MNWGVVAQLNPKQQPSTLSCSWLWEEPPFPSQKGRCLPAVPSPFPSALGAGGQGLHGSVHAVGSVPHLVPTPEGSGSARGHLPTSISGLFLSPSPSLLLSHLDSSLSLWKKP